MSCSSTFGPSNKYMNGCLVAFSLPLKIFSPSFHFDSMLIAIMLSPLIPRPIAFTTFILLTLLWRAMAQDVNSVFKVASGSELGSCDQYMGSLNAQFTEAIAIGAAGLAAIQTIQQRSMSRSQRRMLFSMYGLDVYNYVSGGRLQSGDGPRITNIRSTPILFSL